MRGFFISIILPPRVLQGNPHLHSPTFIVYSIEYQNFILMKVLSISLKICLIFCCIFLLKIPEIHAQGNENAIKISADADRLEWGPCPDFFPVGCNIAVLHGNPAEPNADIFFKVPANTDIPNHRHTSVERMVMIEGEMQVHYEGEEPVMLKEGDYAYGPANKPHTARCGDKPCVLFIAFEEPVDAFPVEE